MAEQLIPVAVFSRPIDAELAKTKLEAEGLYAFVADGNFRMDWFLSGAMEGVRLLVRRIDEARARAILDEDPDQAQAALREVFEESDDERCPSCGSEDTRSRSGSAFRASLAISLAALILAQPIVLVLIGFPVLVFRRRRRCFDCGHQWRDH